MEAHKDLRDETQKTKLKELSAQKHEGFRTSHYVIRVQVRQRGMTSPTEHSLESFHMGKTISRTRRVIRKHICSAVYQTWERHLLFDLVNEPYCGCSGAFS
jgi:hypothetical protein